MEINSSFLVKEMTSMTSKTIPIIWVLELHLMVIETMKYQIKNFMVQQVFSHKDIGTSKTFSRFSFRSP